MAEIAYHIDKALSEKEGVLVVRTGEREWLRIPHPQSIKELKTLAANGKIFLDEHHIAPDFFSTVDLCFVVCPNELKN